MSEERVSCPACGGRGRVEPPEGRGHCFLCAGTGKAKAETAESYKRGAAFKKAKTKLYRGY